MSTFHPNCTLPPPKNNFVWSPEVRGTLDIFWSCVTVIILCTWSILHLNVPPQSTPNGWVQTYWKWHHDILRKVQWMILSIFAPEVTFSKAILDFLAARSSAKEFRAWANADGLPWSLKHSFLVDMGGVMLQFPEDGEDSSKIKSKEMDEESVLNGEPPRTMAVSVTPPPEIEVHHGNAVTMPVAAATTELGATTPEEPGFEAPTVNAEPTVLNKPDGTIREKPNENPTPDVSGRDDDDDDRMSVNRRRWPPVQSPQRYVKWYAEQNEWWERLAGKSPWHVHETNRAAVIGAFRIFQQHMGDPTAIPASVKNEELLELMPGQYTRQNWRQVTAQLQGNLWIPNGQQLLYAREIGLIEELPGITEDEIDSQNQGDALVKAIALYQLLWLIIDVCVRFGADQSISQLEIMTVAFAVDAAITYGFLWNKPKDVSLPKTIQAARFASAAEMVNFGLRGPGLWQSQFRSAFYMREAAYHRQEDASNINNYGWIALASLIFGALHLPAWNFEFPTPVEQTLWRASAIVTMVFPFLFGTFRFVLLVIVRPFVKTTTDARIILNKPLAVFVWNSWRFVVAIIYLAARFYIMVEVFRTLCFLPPDAFKSTSWENALTFG